MDNGGQGSYWSQTTKFETFRDLKYNEFETFRDLKYNEFETFWDLKCNENFNFKGLFEGGTLNVQKFQKQGCWITILSGGTNVPPFKIMAGTQVEHFK